MSELKSPREWEEAKSVDMIVVDPDGWRNAQPWAGITSAKSFDEPITWEEYEKRRLVSTIMFKRGK